MNCTFQCQKSYDGDQVFTCTESSCCTQGWATIPIQRLMNMVNKTTTIRINDAGAGSMHQECMPIAIDFQCSASACEFQNQTIPPLTVSEKIGFGIAGGALAALLIAAVILCVFRAHLLRQRFSNFAGRSVPVSLQWLRLACEIPTSAGPVLALRGSRGAALPGSVTVVLGESGSGKTTLLDMLARRKTVGRLSGDITVNGRPPTSEDWTRVTAYVTQDDVFEAKLTVRETILFSARLRLPSTMANAERELLTDQTIDSLGLGQCRDTEIGSASLKKISGGERKRVALACELVTNPSLLFLDEPTSGLDSDTALRLVASLHRIAHEQQRSVVLSVHQPGSAMLPFFDRVIVLSHGRQVFSGTVAEMESVFGDKEGTQRGQNAAELAVTACARMPPEELDRMAWEEERAKSSLSINEEVADALLPPDHKGKRNGADFEICFDFIFRGCRSFSAAGQVCAAVAGAIRVSDAAPSAQRVAQSSAALSDGSVGGVRTRSRRSLLSSDARDFGSAESSGINGFFASAAICDGSVVSVAVYCHSTAGGAGAEQRLLQQHGRICVSFTGRNRSSSADSSSGRVGVRVLAGGTASRSFSLCQFSGVSGAGVLCGHIAVSFAGFAV